MLRLLRYTVPVLAILLGGLVFAEDRDKKEDPVAKKPDPAGKKPTQGALQFEVDRFLQDFDKNKDKFLSREEVPERLRHSFKEIDTNKDDKLSREELLQGVVYFQPQRRPSDMVYVLIELSDCDEGCVDEVQRAYAILRHVDANQDGKIAPEEMTRARERLVMTRVDNIFKELDEDKDGRIGKDEAKGQIRVNFERIDADGNGSIERKELLTAATEQPSKVSSPGTKGAPPGKKKPDGSEEK